MDVASEINGSSLKRLTINLGSKVQPMLQLPKLASYSCLLIKVRPVSFPVLAFIAVTLNLSDAWCKCKEGRAKRMSYRKLLIVS